MQANLECSAHGLSDPQDSRAGRKETAEGTAREAFRNRTSERHTAPQGAQPVGLFRAPPETVQTRERAPRTSSALGLHAARGEEYLSAVLIVGRLLDVMGS